MKDQGEFLRTVLSGVKGQVWMMHLVDSGDMCQQRGMICTLYVYIMCTFCIMHTWYGIMYLQYYAYAENIYVNIENYTCYSMFPKAPFAQTGKVD